MKVYVDELPKCCLECQLECPYEDRCIDTITMNCSECIGRPTDCPLHSLFDYTKQVRKEVLSELMNMLGDRAELIDFGNGYAEFMFTTYDLQECSKEILDQLQGEIK